MNGGVRFRDQYRKPVIYDECRYEGDLKDAWGNLTAREMVQRFWLGTLSGCYVGHGETYKHPQDILWWSKGGVLHGQSPKRIAVAEGLHGAGPGLPRAPAAGRRQGPLPARQARRVLPALLPGPAEPDADPRGRSPLQGRRRRPVGDDRHARGHGAGRASSPSRRRSRTSRYRFTPYGPGEKTAARGADSPPRSPRALPPLEVRFASSGGGKTRWDFGDGAASDEPNPVHVFEKPGLYSVTLTVTDAEGVERPVVRADRRGPEVRRPDRARRRPRGREAVAEAARHRAAVARTARSASPTGRPGAGCRPATGRWTTCAASARSRSWAG